MEKKINSSVHQNNSEILINGRWCLACSVRPPILVKDSILCYPVISIYYRYPTIIYHKYELLTICTRTSRPLGKKTSSFSTQTFPYRTFFLKYPLQHRFLSNSILFIRFQVNKGIFSPFSCYLPPITYPVSLRILRNIRHFRKVKSVLFLCHRSGNIPGARLSSSFPFA